MNILIQNHEAAVEQLLQLINSAYRGTEGAGRWTTEHHLVVGDRITRQGLLKVIADPAITLFTGVEEEKLVACIAAKHRSETVEFGTFAVAPHLHGRGLGKIMLAHAEAYARGLAKTFQVCVVAQNTQLVEFYLKRGYRDDNIFLDYPKAEEVGVPKRPDLRLKLLSKAA